MAAAVAAAAESNKRPFVTSTAGVGWATHTGAVAAVAAEAGAAIAALEAGKAAAHRLVAGRAAAYW